MQNRYSLSAMPNEHSFNEVQNRYSSVEDLKQENFGRLTSLSNKLMAISPNHLKFADYAQVTSQNPITTNSSLDVIENLYTDNGVGTALASENIRGKLGVDLDQKDTFLISYAFDNKKFHQELSISAGVKTLQGFTFGDRPDQISSDFLVSFPTWLAILNDKGLDFGFDEIMLDKVMIFPKKQFKDKLDQIQIELIKATDKITNTCF